MGKVQSVHGRIVRRGFTLNDKDVSILREVPIFEQVSEDTLNRILGAAETMHFTPQQVIFLEGDRAEHVFVLRKGWIKSVRMTRDGREQTMMFLNPTQIFGDVAVFLNISYPATVFALEDVEVWRVPGAAYLSLIAQHPQLSMAVIRKLSRRVMHYMSLVEDLALRTVDARVANYLMAEAVVENGQLLVPRGRWQTYDQMAGRLGTVRDVLNRTLRSLAEEGMIAVTRRAIVLNNPEKLAQKAQK